MTIADHKELVMPKTEKYLAIIVLCLVVFILWQQFKPAPEVVGQVTAAVESKQVVDVGKVEHACKTITVYKDVAKEKLGLDPITQDDKNKQVVAASVLEFSYHPRDVVTVFDTLTGTFKTVVITKELPLIDAWNEWHIGAGYGYKNTTPSWMLYGDFTPLMVKAASVKLTASVFQDGTYFYGMVGDYRF